MRVKIGQKERQRATGRQALCAHEHSLGEPPRRVLMVTTEEFCRDVSRMASSLYPAFPGQVVSAKEGEVGAMMGNDVDNFVRQVNSNSAYQLCFIFCFFDFFDRNSACRRCFTSRGLCPHSRRAWRGQEEGFVGAGTRRGYACRHSGPPRCTHATTARHPDGRIS